MIQPIPAGYHTVTPYLIIKNAAAAIEFYKKAFNAIEMARMPAPNGMIGHAELKIGDSMIMLADEFPEMDAKGPETFGGSPMSIMLYVEEADKIFQQAIDAGAKILRPLENKFYGDRSGQITDPFGYVWSIATHVEDVTPAEMERRMKEMGEKK